MAAAKRGADRQALHERLREASMQAWQTLEKGGANPLLDLLAQDGMVSQYLTREELARLMRAERHIGKAVERARAFAATLRSLEKSTATASVLDIRLS
jgi:adenylosuccinate lyase